MHEHRLIERVVAVMESRLHEMDVSGRVDPFEIGEIVDFIRTYADRCHHGKEEDILFRRLAEKDLDPQLAASMADLVAEHARARAITARLADSNRRYLSGEQEAVQDVAAAMRELVALYPVHIAKEDREFFKPCLEYFTDEERDVMLRDFEEFEKELLHAKYRLVVEQLEHVPGA